MKANFLEATVGKFIFRVHPAYLYTELGVWVALDEATGVARVGLSDYRQQASGDVAFVDLPQAGTLVSAGQELATIETVKVDLEAPAPFDGQVMAVNEALEGAPELINQAPYGEGWLAALRPVQWPAAGLLDAEQYLAVMIAQAEAEEDE